MFRKKTNRFTCCFENEACNSSNHTRQNLSNFFADVFQSTPNSFSETCQPFFEITHNNSNNQTNSRYNSKYGEAVFLENSLNSISETHLLLNTFIFLLQVLKFRFVVLRYQRQFAPFGFQKLFHVKLLIRLFSSRALRFLLLLF